VKLVQLAQSDLKALQVVKPALQERQVPREKPALQERQGPRVKPVSLVQLVHKDKQVPLMD
jgi:hypothetical protein